MDPEEIRKLYNDPLTGLTGINTFSQRNHLPIDQVRTALRGDNVYTLNAPAVTKFPRRQTMVSGPGVQYQADLVDFNDQIRDNNGFRYILAVIDCFSRFVWVEPLKSKSGKVVAEAMAKILSRAPFPRLLQTDNGKEFYNSEMNKLLTNHGIKLFSTYSPLKATMVERFNRTLRMRLTKLWDVQGNFNWTKQLQNVIQGYNSTKHSTIKMTPTEANDPANKAQVYLTLYASDRPVPVDSDILKPGTHVRIQTERGVFTKRSVVNPWSTEVFQVERVRSTVPITYYLIDETGEEIQGGFYRRELQPVDKPTEFGVEVLDKRTIKRGRKTIKQLFVHWVGHPKSMDSWIDASQLV